MITIIVLWILLGIIALIVILLHFSVVAEIHLSKKTVDIKAKYLFFQIYPLKPRKKKTKRRRKAEKIQKETEFHDSLEDELKEIPDDNIETAVENICEEKTDDIKTTVITKDNIDEYLEENNQFAFGMSEDADAKADEDKHDDIKVEPRKQVEIKKIKPKKKAKSKKNKEKSGKLDGLKEIYNFIKPFIPMGWKYFTKLLKAIRFTNVDVKLTTGMEDAYESAMRYGKLQGAVFYGVAMVSNIFTVKIKRCDVDCVFNQSVFDYDVSFKVRVRPSTMIAISSCVLFNVLKKLVPDFIHKRVARRKATRKRKKQLNIHAERSM